MTTKIAITDDHPMVLKGIQSMLNNTQEIDIVGTYNNATETLKMIEKHQPDILLLDINLPDINGIDLCKQLKKDNKNLKIIAISNFDEISFVRRMLKNGANGYLLKNTDKLELINAFKTVLSGEQYLQKSIEQKLINASIGKKETKQKFLTKLTRREKEILTAIAEELTTQEISDKLFISPKTVETHRMNIMSKLGAKNSAGIIKTAYEQGLLW